MHLGYMFCRHNFHKQSFTNYLLWHHNFYFTRDSKQHWNTHIKEILRIPFQLGFQTPSTFMVRTEQNWTELNHPSNRVNTKGFFPTRCFYSLDSPQTHDILHPRFSTIFGSNYDTKVPTLTVYSHNHEHLLPVMGCKLRLNRSDNL